MRPFRICKHVEDQDGRTNRQIQEQKRALKKLPWKRKSLVLAVFVLLRGRFRERFRRNGKRDLGMSWYFLRGFAHIAERLPQHCEYHSTSTLSMNVAIMLWRCFLTFCGNVVATLLKLSWNMLQQLRVPTFSQLSFKGVWMGVNRIENWGPYLLLNNELEPYFWTISE